MGPRGLLRIFYVTYNYFRLPTVVSCHSRDQRRLPDPRCSFIADIYRASRCAARRSFHPRRLPLALHRKYNGHVTRKRPAAGGGVAALVNSD